MVQAEIEVQFNAMMVEAGIALLVAGSASTYMLGRACLLCLARASRAAT